VAYSGKGPGSAASVVLGTIGGSFEQDNLCGGLPRL
jgi:hypothetical protein